MVYAVDLSKPGINPIAKFADFATILNLVIPLTTIAGAAIFLIMLFWGGFTILTAGGNAERYAQGRKTLGFAVVGLAIVFVAFLLVQLISFVLKINTPFFSG